jgi:hypothetical protein
MSERPSQEPLRVVVVVGGVDVPEWTAWTIRRIAALPELALEALVVTGAFGRADAGSTIAGRVFERADARAFGAAAALRSARIEPVAAASDTADVVVALVADGRAAWTGPPPRLGVWALAPLEDGPTPPERFADQRDRRATTATALVRVDGMRWREVARTTSAVHPLSLTQTRNGAAWASAHMVVRALRAAAGGARTPPVHERAPAAVPVPPSPAATAAQAAAAAGRALAARTRAAWSRPEWFVAVRRRSADGAVAGPFQPLPNPPGRYLADPFPFVHDGAAHLFVEDYDHARRRGVIAVCDELAGGGWSAPRPVLAAAHHLSYPFVFAHEGDVYLLPEAGESGSVRLHRAVSFPDVWEPDRVLLDGLRAVDATLHMDDGRVWLFAHVVEGPGDAGALHLWSATSLDGPWAPHPRNPVAADPFGARPAGRLFCRDGVLIRPGQDCTRRYGEAVVWNRVDVLAPDDYAETAIGRLAPDWQPGLLGAHTFNSDDRHECVDWYRRVRRPLRGPR